MTKHHQGQLENALYQVGVFNFTDYRIYLNRIYKYLKEHCKTYSYIYFSQDLNLGNTNASRLIIHDQRNLGPKTTDSVANALGLKGLQKKYFKAMVAYTNAQKSQERDKYFEKMINYKNDARPQGVDPNIERYFSDWLCVVIREMSQLPGFKGDPKWIQGQLEFPLRLDEIKKAMSLLESLGLLTQDEKTGKYLAQDGVIKAPERGHMLTMKKFQSNMINVAKDALTRVESKRRYINAITLTLNDSQIEVLAKKLDQILDEVLELEVNNEVKTNVTQLNVQLFPFTKKMLE